jgi:hypothetical protein
MPSSYSINNHTYGLHKMYRTTGRDQFAFVYYFYYKLLLHLYATAAILSLWMWVPRLYHAAGDDPSAGTGRICGICSAPHASQPGHSLPASGLSHCLFLQFVNDKIVRSDTDIQVFSKVAFPKIVIHENDDSVFWNKNLIVFLLQLSEYFFLYLVFVQTIFWDSLSRYRFWST